MTGFVTIAVLICQMSAGKPMQCYDKGTANLRGSEVQSFSKIEYYKCNTGYKECNMETKWDGCKYSIKGKDVAYSSYTCP